MTNFKFLLILFISHFTISAVAQETSINFKMGHQEIVLEYKSDNAEIIYELNEEQTGVVIATITLQNEMEFSPKELNLKWALPSNNIAGYWSSHAYLDKTITPDWGPAKVKSMVIRESPVICLFGHNDLNRQTFAVSEVLNTVVTSTSIKEENGMIINEIKLFTEKHRDLKTYQFQFRIDTRAIEFSKAIKDVADWWATFDLYKPSLVPESAKLPIYSSWYSYHQNVSKDALLEECRLAKTMGFESIIVDDGWQTTDSNRGYAYTGDWNPDRIKDMEGFVNGVHELDMKFLLWYAVPLVGEKSEAYKKMKGKFLNYWEGQGAYVLDPRFLEVRGFIIETYVNAVNEWDLDGFKLDFLGMFRVYSDTRLVADEGRDYASVNEATDRLMTDLMESLRAIKPDIMIEFRQPYSGPAMRKYGNMLRASDCPNIALVNRVSTSDLKLLSGNTAVHADMLMWHNDEAVEVAALQLLNVIFSVPQISVRLEAIPNDHFEMIRFYLDYWLKNRDILLDGGFIPSSPLTNYPSLSAETKDKTITAVYSDLFIPMETSPEKTIDIINAKSSTRIILDVKGKSQSYNYVIFNCKGKEIDKGIIEFNIEDVFAFDVPASGLISLVPIK